MSSGFGNIPVVDPFVLLRSGEKLNTPDLSKLTPEEKKAKLKEIASQFEEVFIETLLKTAREAEKIIKKDEDNYGLNLGFYREMQDYYLSQSIVADGGLGLQDLIVEQLMDKLDYTISNPEKMLEKAEAMMRIDKINVKNERYREQIEEREDFEEIVLPKAEKISCLLDIKTEKAYPFAVQSEVEDHSNFSIWLQINFDIQQEKALAIIDIIEKM